LPNSIANYRSAKKFASVQKVETSKTANVAKNECANTRLKSQDNALFCELDG